MRCHHALSHKRGVHASVQDMVDLIRVARFGAASAEAGNDHDQSFALANDLVVIRKDSSECSAVDLHEALQITLSGRSFGVLLARMRRICALRLDAISGCARRVSSRTR